MPCGHCALGIAGLGFAVDVHLPAFRSIPGIEVVALLGQRPERAEEANRRTGLPVDVNVSTWLDRDLDAVSVAVPPQAVAPVVSAVLQRKLPVLCEKPLGVSSTEAQTLAAQAEGIVTALDFQFADLDCFRSLKAAIDEGVLGTIRHVSVTWLTNSYTHRAGLWSWKTDRGRAGGVLTLLGTHLLYLAEWLLGPATELAARLDAHAAAPRRPVDAAAADDLLVLATQHANGAVLAATVSNASPGVSVHRWIVVGDRASAIVENETRDYMAGFTLRILDKIGRGGELAYRAGDGRGRQNSALSQIGDALRRCRSQRRHMPARFCRRREGGASRRHDPGVRGPESGARCSCPSSAAITNLVLISAAKE